MSKQKKNSNNSDKTNPQAPQKNDDVKVSGWSDDMSKVHYRKFPGPASASQWLRISFDSQAYADILGHARESLDAEICGVMVGDLCQDDHGLYVDVKGAIRGSTSRSGGTHVTYTQETWDEIHKVRESEYPKLSIVGWYHSHPGFGVNFSDMDKFIQQNFFSDPAQFALVTDPLSGDEAICANHEGQIKPISRFWVNGRERRCRNTEPQEEENTDSLTTANIHSPEIKDSINQLEQRISQLMQFIEETQNSNHRANTFLMMFVAVCIIGWIGYQIVDGILNPYIPPKEIGEVAPMPLADTEGNNLGFVGIKAYWHGIPPERTLMVLENMLIEQLKDPTHREAILEKIKQIEADEKEALEKEAQKETPPTTPPR